jgi:mitochondrial fission protein ELM1
VAPLEGGSRKFRRFHELMAQSGATRPFTGALERWRYDPVDDTARIGALIRSRVEARAP